MEKAVNINRHILGGTPVFNGTRVPIQSLFDYLEHGSSISEFIEQFPTVRKNQVEALLNAVVNVNDAD